MNFKIDITVRYLMNVHFRIVNLFNKLIVMIVMKMRVMNGNGLMKLMHETQIINLK